MNKEQAENGFQVGLRELVENVTKELSLEAPDPYAGAGQQTVLEHTTRIYFFDRFLELLGWSLGIHGDVVEEARIKAETTTFMDYVGVNQTTRVPALLVEAKAWGKPFIVPRDGAGFEGSKRQLITAAIQHINEGGEKEKSPVIGIWHDDLLQVRQYVRDFREQHEHNLPRAVLSSGQWMIVFTDPITTFFNGEVNDEQFEVFRLESYVEDARRLFALLNQRTLAGIIPFSLRPSQLLDYVAADKISAVFHGVHIKYEESGSALFTPRPRILIYPALIFQRNDNIYLTIIDREWPIVMGMRAIDDTDEKSLAPHLIKVEEEAKELLEICSNEVGMPLVPFQLFDFPGFHQSVEGTNKETSRKQVVRPLGKVGDEWLLVTGVQTHYLMETPTVNQCKFHSWTNCQNINREIGAVAISTACTRPPRSFFTDSQIYHCAHQTIQDRRHSRCYIAALDARTCCRACIYQNLCWSSDELNMLPCGH